MGKWVSVGEAAAHLDISPSAVRKRAVDGKMERKPAIAGRKGNYLYWLDDEEINAELAVESAMDESGVDVLAQVIHEATSTQKAAMEALREAHKGQVASLEREIATQQELARSLRMRAEQAESELRSLREHGEKRAEETDRMLREWRKQQEQLHVSWWRRWR